MLPPPASQLGLLPTDDARVYRIFVSTFGGGMADSAPTKLPYISPAQVDAVVTRTGVDKKKFRKATRNLRAAVDGKKNLHQEMRVCTLLV